MGFVRKIVLLAAAPIMALGQTNDAENAEADAPGDGFAQYETILKRMPFGEPPPNFNPDAPKGLPPRLLPPPAAKRRRRLPRTSSR